MFVFVHPWMFVLLPLPWLLGKWLPAPSARDLAVRVPFGDRIKAANAEATVVEKIKRRWAAQFVTGLVWVLLVTSLAKPERIEPPIHKTLPTRDLLLLVDLSGSMKKEDFTSPDGKTSSRLDAVKQVVGDFLVKRKGDRVGLVVFGDAPFLQAPFSTDLELVRSLLDETAVGMAGPRTAFGDAIGLGIGLFDGSDVPAKTIIALTDGNDTASQVPPVEAARVAHQRGIRIHTVAIGDPTTVGEEKLDEATLRSVAKTADGSYFFAADRNSLENIYTELDKIETRKIKEVSHRPRFDLYFWPLLAAILISLLARTVRLVGNATHSPQIKTREPVHVNPRTGELEAVG